MERWAWQAKFNREDKRAYYTARCRKCGRVVEFPAPNTRSIVNPALLFRKFADKGMAVKGNSAKCHSCKEHKQMDNASTPALKAQRELFRYLDLHFVDGAYTDDYTDEKLAKELGLSAKFVTNVREEAYGKFAVPQGLIDLAKEVGEAQAMINEMNRDVLNPLAKRVNDAMKAYG